MSDAPAAAAGGAGRGWRSGASLQRAGAAALALGSGGFLVLRCAFSPCVPLIVQGGTAPWITDPRITQP